MINIQQTLLLTAPAVCEVCGDEMTADKLVTVDTYNRRGEKIRVCDECKQDLRKCEYCRNYFLETDGREISNLDFYCDRCYANNIVVCCECGDEILFDNARSMRNGGDYICESCYENDYATCDICGHVVRACDTYSCEECRNVVCDHCSCCDGGNSEYSFFRSRSMYIPNDYEKFTRGDYLISARPVGCEIETEIESEGHNIAEYIPEINGLSGDGSLDHGVEIITPPLCGKVFENNIIEIEKACHSIELNARQSCGLHIHLDANDFRNDDKKIKHVLQTYYLIEQVLYGMLPASRTRGTYARPLAQRFTLDDIKSREDLDLIWYIDKAKKTSKGWLSTSEQGNVISTGSIKPKKMTKKEMRIEFDSELSVRKRNKMDGSRYHGLNVHSIFYRGTVEIRHHSGTTSAKKIFMWVKINQAIIDYATKQFRFKKLLEIYQDTNKTTRIDKFTELFGLDDTVKQYIIERTQKFTSPEVIETD